MEEDYFKKGKQLYEVEKTIKGINLPFKDGRTTIFINAENKGREELDNLMQSLIAKDYREMKDEVIKESAMYYKTAVEGEEQVCDIVQAYAEKYAEKRAEKSYNEGTVNTLLKLVDSGNISLGLAIKNSGLSKNEFLDIASRLGYKL